MIFSSQKTVFSQNKSLRLFAEGFFTLYYRLCDIAIDHEEMEQAAQKDKDVK